MKTLLRGKDIDVKCCLSCSKPLSAQEHTCPRCNKSVDIRIKNSAHRTSMLLIISFFMYIPANMIPMFIFHKMGSSTENTIMQGISILFNHNMYFIAALVFVASIVIPIFKIVSLSVLLLFVKFSSIKYIKKKIFLYRIVERIGRWSMLDIFVISVMLSLLDFGPLISITISWGTSAFGCVVILTMFAASTFDPRILWDAVDNKSSKNLEVKDGR